VPFDTAHVGSSRDSEEFRVNTYRLAQFAASLGDDNPRTSKGEVAPPTFAHIPVMQSMMEVLWSVDKSFYIHGEQDFHFRRPIVPGQRLKTVTTLQSMRNSGAGAAFVVRSDTSDQSGPVVTQYAVVVARGQKLDRDVGEPAPAKPAELTSGKTEEITIDIPTDLGLRYAESSRDYSPYTIEKAAAEKLGFPAPILHGLCTLALAARHVVDRACGGDVAKLKRLGARFSHPLYLTPGQKLVTRLKLAPGRVDFECTDAEGTVVVKRGFAEISQ
jgi:acyl dehydratase